MEKTALEHLWSEFATYVRSLTGFDLDALSPDETWFLARIGMAVLVLGLVAWGLIARSRARRRHEAEQRRIAEELLRTNHALETQLSELKGRIGAMADMGAQRQGELAATLDTRLDQVASELARTLRETRADMDRHLADATTRLSHGLTENTAQTSDHLSQLAERLAVIDRAQQNLTDLSGRVVSLQNVLANKQARGAFGQVRMETIIQDGLPSNAYTFQATLSNGKRPDCVIRLPNASAGIVVDAKFPLEGFEALRQATTPEEDKAAASAIRQAIGHHVAEIASKYLLPGETQDTALMFVPSEAAYADLHEQFPDLIQKAHRAHIFIVSPNMLMLAVQTMQAILKDVQVREAAGEIQREVALMLTDVARLGERLGDLERQFSQSQKSLEKLSTSAGKITSRGRRIEALELDEPASEAATPLPPAPRIANS